MEILERDEDLCSKETRCGESEAVSRLFAEERVEVSAGAVVDQEAGVVRNVNARVESREKRMIQHMKDFCFCFCVS